MGLTYRKNTGNLGEKIAANFLKKKGWKIIELNYRNNFGRQIGEIDIIAKDYANKEIVFVEVKTRDNLKYSHTIPEENITPKKLRKLEKIANSYLQKNNLLMDNYRFDAISVWLDKTQNKARIKHISHL